ncbi:uncharacterized protein LOC102713140 [Oryza brachyantha]|uniref:uncharacterized protein LOC102713140 n=1 Tax=Oryza brachyantha TaxID=4533 RepID=UPI000776597D|nr:uncharacterized protein LOC102713140 [Oryza brachyantha]
MASGGKDVVKEARSVLLQEYDGDHKGALARAVKLSRSHPRSAMALRLAGDLHHAAAIRARNIEKLGGKVAIDADREAIKHVELARQALSKAKQLVPDCVDIATALGDVFAFTTMYQEAEVEYNYALAIPLPVDPALHNAAYGLHGRDRTTVNERVKEAREKADVAYGRLTEQLIDISVGQMFEASDGAKEVGALLQAKPGASATEILKAERDAALEQRKNARSLAEAFPGSSRAQCFYGYMDLKFNRLLDESIDKRSFVRRSTLSIVDRAAEKFPNSMVIASFRAKLLYILGDYDAAEKDCRRALNMKNPDDPADDCVPPGSISGPNRGAREVSLSCVFHELINKIVGAANDYWSCMTEQKRSEFLSVRFDALQEEYNKVDRASFSVWDVLIFVEKHKSYRFWICPFCDNHSKKHTDTASLLSHMCSKHQRAVLPRLQSALDQKLDCTAFDSDLCSFNRITFSQDSDQNDIVCFKERDQMFRWLFDKPSSGIGTHALSQIIERKRTKGIVLLEHIKEKLKTLAADKFSTEFAEALPGIQELWIKFVQGSAVDYREVILAIGRSLLWMKLKKCMSEDPEVGAKRICAADIDEMLAIAAYNYSSGAVEVFSHSDEAQKINQNHQGSDFHGENRSSGTTVDMKLQDPPTNMDENGNKLDEQLEKLEIDLNSARSSPSPQPSTPNENRGPDILDRIGDIVI